MMIMITMIVTKILIVLITYPDSCTEDAHLYIHDHTYKHLHTHALIIASVHSPELHTYNVESSLEAVYLTQISDIRLLTVNKLRIHVNNLFLFLNYVFFII